MSRFPIFDSRRSLPLSPGSVSARLNEITLLNNIPAAVTIELTRRCPLSCAHCYLPETRGRASASSAYELTTAQWKRILKSLAGAGSVYLVFTGGEPLLRPDLAVLCRYAKELRFDVRVYSSGFGMTRARTLEFKQAGVSAFEISLYGRAETHDAVTGLKGSFKKTLAAAIALKKAGVKVKLKTPLMKANIKERGYLERLAKEYGFGISFDPVIAPGNDGDTDNLGLRLNSSELAGVLGSLGGRKLRSFSGSTPQLSASHALSFDFLCGAGRNVAAVDPYGNLSPCLQIPVNLGNISKAPFKKIWKAAPWLKRWRALKTRDLKECRTCSYLDVCNRCPGISLIEKKDILASNSPACAIARAMR